MISGIDSSTSAQAIAYPAANAANATSLEREKGDTVAISEEAKTLYLKMPRKDGGANTALSMGSTESDFSGTMSGANLGRNKGKASGAAVSAAPADSGKTEEEKQVEDVEKQIKDLEAKMQAIMSKSSGDIETKTQESAVIQQQITQLQQQLTAMQSSALKKG